MNDLCMHWEAEKCKAVPKGFTLIDSEELEELREVERWANALRDGGVDEWEGYDYAMEILREQLDEEAAPPPGMF